MRIAAALILALSGCATAPKVETITVTVTKLVPVPEQLTRDCYDESPREQTVAEAKRLAGIRRASLSECTNRMRQIRKLGSP